MKCAATLELRLVCASPLAFQCAHMLPLFATATSSSMMFCFSEPGQEGDERSSGERRVRGPGFRCLARRLGQDLAGGDWSAQETFAARAQVPDQIGQDAPAHCILRGSRRQQLHAQEGQHLFFRNCVVIVAPSCWSMHALFAGIALQASRQGDRLVCNVAGCAAGSFLGFRLVCRSW